MRKLFILLTLCGSLKAWAEQRSYPVDFDDSFFKKSPYSRWMRDPFKNPPGFAKGSADKIVWPKLSSVNIDGPVRTATLDGRSYNEGQFIDEQRYISAIGQNYVIVTEGKFDYELVIADPKRGLASDSKEKK